MSNLTPELRTDKNGKVVTRHVNNESDETAAARAIRINAVSKPKPVVDTAISMDPGYDYAKRLFGEENPDNAELLNEFFVGSVADDIDLDELVAKNELDEGEYVTSVLPNGRTAVWIDEENLNIPGDASITLDSTEFQDVVEELQAIKRTDEGYRENWGSNGIEVLASYHTLFGSDSLSELVDKSEESYRGHYDNVADFGEQSVKSIWGIDSSEGMSEVENYVDWAAVASDMDPSEFGDDDDDTSDGEREVSEEDARDYYTNSIGSYEHIESSIDWEAAGEGFMSDFRERDGHYFRVL